MLKHVHENVFTAANGHRSGVRNVLVIVTDGIASDPDKDLLEVGKSCISIIITIMAAIEILLSIIRKIKYKKMRIILKGIHDKMEKINCNFKS